MRLLRSKIGVKIEVKNQGKKLSQGSLFKSKKLKVAQSLSHKVTYWQGLTGTRYPTRPDNFWQYPIHTRFIFRIIGYFGYRVFHLFWPNVPVTIQYCFNPHNICQVWTCHQSSLQRIQFLKSYNRDVGTVIYKIMPIIRHCAPFCTHYFFFPRNMLFSHKFMHFCHDFVVVEI